MIEGFSASLTAAVLLDMMETCGTRPTLVVFNAEGSAGADMAEGGTGGRGEKGRGGARGMEFDRRMHDCTFQIFQTLVVII